MVSVVIAAVPFVHPVLAGLALAFGLIPILIHLINRRRFIRVPWAAMTFLLAANQRSVRRIQMERLLLLLTRTLLIIAMGFVLARPYISSAGILPFSTSRVHRVLIIDNSMSMNASSDQGPTRFETARRYAEYLLGTFPTTDSVSLVTMARPARAVVAHAAFDRRFVRQQLSRIQATSRPTDTIGALHEAEQALQMADVAQGNRSVYIITDLPRYDWVSSQAESETPAVGALRRLASLLVNPAVDLNVIRIGTAEEAAGLASDENLAITEITTQSMLAGVDLPVRIRVTVKNFGSTALDDVRLQIRRNGQIIRRELLPAMDPQRTTTATITTQFSTEGTHVIEARLAHRVADMLREDDTRSWSVEIRRTTPVLVVDGQPGPTPLSGQSGYLVTALAPRPHRLGPFRNRRGESATGAPPTPAEPKVISAAELAAEPLEAYDAIALCNVPQLSPETWNRFNRFIARGGGVILFLGDRINIDNYNRHGYAEGAGILPGLFQDKRGTDASRTPLGLELGQSLHPIVREFSGKPESGLFSVRVDEYVPLELDEAKAEVVLRYTDGHPALTASSVEKPGGRVLVFTSTVNLAWNNLPAKGDFVSLVYNAVAFLAPQHGQHRNISVGQSIREPLTARQHALPLRVSVGSGMATEPPLVPDGDGLAVSFGPIEHADLINLSIGSEVRRFAANVDTEDSDLRVTDRQIFLNTVNQPLRLFDAEDMESAEAAEVSTTRLTELSSTLIYAVMGLLLAECWMAMWFGAPKTTGRQRKTASS